MEIRMKNIKKSILAIALMLSVSNILGIGQDKIKPHSGRYEELLIGIDQDGGVITGFYENGTGWDEETKAPRFVCRFYLYGEKQEDSFKIITWWPGDDLEDPINGELTFNADDSVSVRLESEHGGCWNVNHFADKDPSKHSLDKTGSWTSIRVVKGRRAYFHDKPDAQTRRRAYLIKDNVIRIFSQMPGWVLAEFGDEKISRGWIKQSDLYDFRPTSKK
jgi:hypothetical protein